jgi:hypothetical protein
LSAIDPQPGRTPTTLPTLVTAVYDPKAARDKNEERLADA